MKTYVCKGCKATSERSIGGWRIQCSCGKYMECLREPWIAPPKSIPEQLKAYRDKQKYSQALMAEVIGISQGQYSEMESGVSPISKKMALHIRENIKTIILP